MEDSMLKITETLSDFETYSTVLGYDPKDSLFFDIETTGLSPASSIVFLIGTVHYVNGSWQMTQFLAQSPEDEPELLCAFFQLAAGFRTLIHFNGTTFDIPYLKERGCPLSDLYQNFCQMDSLDLYQCFRPLKKLLNLPRMNQQTLEQFLGWPRQDQLTGKHMISLFKKYTASGESLLSDLLLLHNHDDLLGMLQLLKLAAYKKLPEGNIRLIETSFYDTIGDNNNRNDTIRIHFQLEQPLPSHLSVSKPVDCESAAIYQLNIQKDMGCLTVPCFCGELKYFFPDYRNYYYLPAEDQAIHKSIGAFVDAQHRKNARPDTCYTRKSSVFLPQPKPVIEPVFQPIYHSKDLYFEYTETVFRDSEKLLCYVISILQYICRH